jgi:putative serine protease PepD
MSQDMTPRAGDQPAGARDGIEQGGVEPTGAAQSGAADRGGYPAAPRYSAPSPSDTQTARSYGSAGYRGTPPSQAWSQAAGSGGAGGTGRPGPGETGVHAGWQPRPSGAWSSQPWATAGSAPGSSTSTGRYTQTLPPSGPDTYLPPGQTGYPAGPAGGPGSTTTAKPRGRKTSLVVATTTALALVAGVAGGWAGAALHDNSTAAADSSLSRLNTSPSVSQNLTPAPAGSVQEVAAKVLPSVVSVLASSSQSAGEGSGVILTADGLILTNNHVVDGATDLEVRFNDGTTATATVVGKTATDDLAVIKADGVSGLTPASLGSSGGLQVGQQVVAIGSPLGLSATVTSGIVSALNRPVRTASEEQTSRSQSQDTVINAVQTDAAINPGNSGGALVDMGGNVIGINSAIASLSDTSGGGQAGNIGVGFAIPIDQAKRIAQEIIDNGKATHAVLGASVGDATDGNSQIPTGAKIASVTQGSGAESAGLQDGDVVTSIGDVKIESADALIAAVRAQTPNGTTTVTFTRDGKSQTVNVTLGSAAAN